MNKLSVGALLFLMAFLAGFMVSANVMPLKREAAGKLAVKERVFKRAAGINKKKEGIRAKDEDDFKIDDIVKKVNQDTKKKFKVRFFGYS